MKNIHYVVAGTLLLAASSFQPLYSQDQRTAYFLRGFHYRYLMNPALAEGQNYFSLPGLGNLDITSAGNLGVSHFLYPTTNSMGEEVLSTFMHRDVDAHSFLNRLKRKNRHNADVDLTLLSMGVAAWGGYNTFAIDLHSETNLKLPFELFDFMKTGQIGGTRTYYELKDVSARTHNYVDVAFGHSRNINDRLRLGASFKVLFGVARSDVKWDRMGITLSDNEWIVDAQGEMHTSLRSNPYEVDDKGEITGFDIGDFGLAGWGIGFDLGASYRLLDNLTLSASVTDLGFMSWSKTYIGMTNNDPYSFDGFGVIGIGSDSEYATLDDQFDDLGDDLEDLVRFYDAGEQRSTKALAATMYVGVEYQLPTYDKFSFGILSTTHFNRPYTWTEGRISGNISPTRWFDASVSGSYSHFGFGCGAMLNFHPKGFSFFVGSDMLLTEVNPQFLPVRNGNLNVTLGINFPLNNADL